MTVEIVTGAYVLAAKTSLSPPEDATHFYGPPGLFAPDDVARVMVSATFTWDKRRAEFLAEQWQGRYPGTELEVGGPAYGDPGGEFVPGRWLRQGITITTRGCPGCSSPCLVPEREGGLRLLEVKDGWNVQDNNLLAAPREHIEAVLDMLDRQPQAAVFGGGLEPRRLLRMNWLISRLASMRLQQLFLAYDCPEERGPALEAVRALCAVGIGRRKVRCYVLVGRDGDTLEAAEERLWAVWQAGGMPFAMLWRDSDSGRRRDVHWAALVRKWSRPAAMFATETT